MKTVIHIFGASGSGVTTLGAKICEATGFLHMDTDDYFWLPTDPKFTTKRPAEKRLALMTSDIERSEGAVISGSLDGWGDGLIPYFTLAVRLETDQELRIERLRRREMERFGTRIAPGGDMYRQHTDFIEWAKAYDNGGPEQRSKLRHDVWQEKLPCGLLRLDGADSPEVNAKKVLSALQIMKEI